MLELRPCLSALEKLEESRRGQEGLQEGLLCQNAKGVKGLAMGPLEDYKTACRKACCARLLRELREWLWGI